MPTNIERAVPPGVYVLRKPIVLSRVGFSHTQLYREIRSGRFPAPIWLGRNSVGWLAHEIDDWLAARVAERDGSET